MQLAEGWCDRLRADGVDVRAFRTSRTALPININFRNHRKVVIVDGRVAFLGGLNVGDEYMGESPVFGPWRDRHVFKRIAHYTSGGFYVSISRLRALQSC